MKRTSILLLILLLSACAGIQVENPLHSPKAEDVARFKAMPTMDAVKEVENALAAAKNDEFDYFAPDHYRMAGSAIREARDFMLRNAPQEQVANKVAVADAVIKNGQMFMRNVKNILKDELVQKQKLESMNASNQYGQEFDNLLDRLGQIIRQIENGKIAEASKQRPALRNDLDNLEMRAVVYNKLHEPREIMRRVKNRGGETLVPITYADASAVMIQSEQYIQNNYKDTAAVQKIADEAMFAARRALYLTEEVAALSHRVKTSLEQLVLDEEYRLFRIARSLPVEDIRDNPLEVQSEIIAKAANSVSQKADEQTKLARMYQSQLENDDDAIARINAMNDAVRDIENERGNWQAKQALYEAKLEQLKVSLKAEQSKQKTLLLEKEVLTQAFTQMSLREQLQANMVTEEQVSSAQPVSPDPSATIVPSVAVKKEKLSKEADVALQSRPLIESDNEVVVELPAVKPVLVSTGKPVNKDSQVKQLDANQDELLLPEKQQDKSERTVRPLLDEAIVDLSQ